MKHYLLFVIVLSNFLIPIQAQNVLSKGPSYNIPIQIDSSNIYIIPKVLDKTNINEYSQDFRNYSTQVITDLIIYNSKTLTSKSLFSKQRSLIYPLNEISFSGGYTIYPPLSGMVNSYKSSLILQDKLLFVTITSDYNNDGIISEDDAISIHISDKDGNNLTQITPSKMNLLDLGFSRDYKTAFILLQNDTNNDKSFKNETAYLYQINLNNEISNIKPIKILL